MSQRVRRAVRWHRAQGMPRLALIRNERHLERVLTEFVEHYNSARPHRGIDLEVPVSRVPDRPLDGSVQIRRIDRLGGVLCEYSIAA